MKLCPNCSEIFEDKAGLLFCKMHGWHTLNESGEVVPAAEPTADELAAADKETARQSEPSTTLADNDLPVIESQSDVQSNPVPAQGLAFSGRSGTVIVVIACAACLAVIGYALYQNRKRQHEQQQ